MTKRRDKQVESYTGTAGPTLGVTVLDPERMRRAQVVAADIVLEACGNEDATAAIREIVKMLGLKQLTGLEKY